MINLFQFASNDKSLDYLRDIFGNMNGIIPNPGGSTAGTSITLLGTMFKTFNSVILAVGALIVVYVTIVGVMKTAHEGEPLGKHWNNLWIPIRTVLGIAALVPTSAGYSAIQMLMMWVIVQGIGAADTLWNTVLGYVQLTGSPYGQVTIPSVGVYNGLGGLFQALSCQATAKMAVKDPSGMANGGYFCYGSSSGFCSSGVPPLSSNPAITTYSVGPAGACGVLTYCSVAKSCEGNKANSLACTSCKAQVAALADIIPVLSGIATQFAQADYSYRDFFYNSGMQASNANWSWIYDYCSAHNPPISQSDCCVPPRIPNPNQVCKASTSGTSGNPDFLDPNNDGYPNSASDEVVRNIYWPYAIQPVVGGEVDFISTSVNYYTNSVGQAVTTYIAAMAQDQQKLGGDLKDAAKTGWIFAGSYYYTIAEGNNNNLQESLPVLTMESVNPNVSTSNAVNGFRNNYTAAAALMSAAGGGSGFLGSNSQLSQIGGVVNSANDTASKTFSSTASGEGGSNPLAALQITGTILLAVVMLLFPVLMLATFAIGTAGAINWFTLGTGMISPLIGGLALLYLIFVPAMFAFMGIMIALGGTLGIYIPLIPYIIFTFGAIGWLIMTIETMVAAPIVALGILSPGGEHEILGKASHALMYLFDVFLRPSLMIFGLMAAMLLATVVVNMINYAFWTTVLKGIAFGSGAAMANPLELVIYLSAYVSLLVAALNKCFQAIYIIPQGVMKWIGGQAAQYGGETEAVGEAKSGISAAGGGIKGALSGSQGGSQKLGDETRKRSDERAKRNTNFDLKGGGGDEGGKGR